MDQPTSEPTGTNPPRARKRYASPTLHSYGRVRDLTKTLAAGPNFDGGGGANIYAS